MSEEGMGPGVWGLGHQVAKSASYPVPTPQAPNPHKQRKFLRWLLIALVLLVVILAALLIAFRIVLARAPEYRAQVQAWVSERTNLNIEFARLDARWRFYGPELVFDQAVVRSRDGKRSYISARRVRLGYDIWTAIGTLRLAAGRLTIEAPELQVVRTIDGRFEVVGQHALPERDPNHPFEPDAIATGRLHVIDARVSFRDLKANRGPWVVPGVSFQLRRSSDAMQLSGAAQLPSSLGKSLRFSAQTAGKLADTQALTWQFEVEARELRLAGWAEFGPPNSLAPTKGNGSFKLAGALQGSRIDELSAQLRFEKVVLSLPVWSLPLPATGHLQIDPQHAEGQTVAAAEDDAIDSSLTTVDAPQVVTVPPTNVARESVARENAARESESYEVVAFDLKVVHQQQKDIDDTEVTRSQDTWQIDLKNLELSRPGSVWRDASVTTQVVTNTSIDKQDPLAAADPSRVRIFKVEARANALVLENLWPLLSYAPESPLLAQVRASAAAGRVQDVELQVVRDAAVAASSATEAAPLKYSLKARMVNVSAKAIAKAPGFERFSGTLQADESGGVVQLNIREGLVAIPRLFRAALPADRVTGSLEWKHERDGWRINTQDLVIDNSDGHASAVGEIFIPADKTSPIVNVKAVGSNLVARAAPRYMPAGKLSRGTLAWMDRAFPIGKVSRATLELRGPVRAFPFRKNEGLFLIEAHIEGLTMDYQPGWMPATGLVIDAEFRNQGLSGTVLQGDVNGLQIKSAAGRIADFRQPVLDLAATTVGGLDKALEFVQRSPVGPEIGKSFMALRATGELQSDVQLQMLLQYEDTANIKAKMPAERKLTIDTKIVNATVSTAAVEKKATRVGGRVIVQDHALKSIDMQGQFLNGPFTLTGGAEGRYFGAGAGVQVAAQGRAAGKELAELMHLPASIPMGGNLAWRLNARIPRHGPDEPSKPTASVDSDGKGLVLGLPEPIGKTAEQSRALHFDIETTDERTLLLRGLFGKTRALARLAYRDNAWTFDRAGLRVDGIAAALPAHSGVRIEGNIERFVLDDWLKIKGDRPGGKPISDYLRAANVRVQQFGLYGYTWNNVRGILQATDTKWRVDVLSEDITGQLHIPYTFDSGVPLDLALSKLDIGARSGGGPATHADPRDLPALRGRIDELLLSGRPVGMARVDIQKVPQGIQLNELELRGASFAANAHGAWLAEGSESRSSLTFDITSTDARTTLRALNYHDVITAARANVHADLSWPGGPDENLLGRSTGEFMIEMGDGQLLGVKPGAGRVLGLMSLSALPRRLSLDFRDLTDKGLAFDTVRGNFELKNGDAFTTNLVLRGPVAEIGIVGRTGLGTHDYDQTAVVTGDIGGSLGVAGAVVGGPVVGAALLVFSRIFKEPLKGVARAYYRISGPWDEPVVERIDKDDAQQSPSKSIAQDK